MNTTPIFPGTPYIGHVSLADATACTTRAPTATASLAGANIIAFVPTSTNGRRIDKIQVDACSSAIGATTAAQIVGIWAHDGTNAFLIDEFVITAQTPSATAAAFTIYKKYANLVLPAGHSLYVSTTVTTTASTTALQVSAFGGDY